MSPRPKQALDLTTILETAVKIADEAGVAEVTLANLAKELNIRPPSLYNHFDGLSGLQENLALYGIKRLYESLASEAVGLAGEEAVMSLAKAYIEFARKHPGLYEATLSPRNINNEEFHKIGDKIVDLTKRVLTAYGLEGESVLHAVRGLRSILHGFSSLEQKGGFGMVLDTDLSLRLILKSFLKGIDEMNGEDWSLNMP
ncbi:TetR family transcriptional regulator [Bacillus sp. FJAT-27225]|uniref:TetR/AcrR family transcriptional regulator n=1 Tax=Bacillus sp. FJAT-27225 TaxID=1743144 RepID=UPI00080C288E|nr:TetR/AcrR family transcriptional regulator [Bacillus sp. FJAT-27225]OCA84153.1 TetR family transcriptional regulator [Bacillus sp. FJAT-27225]